MTDDEPPLLTGLRVLDLTRLLPGPFATRLLSDYGAEVIKIESPQHPDLTRLLPPYVDGEGVAHHALNRGKRSLALDIKAPEGWKVMMRLVARAQVLVESFRPGVLDRLGLDYKTCQGANPSLVYASLSGYGADGPMAGQPGHDLNFMALSGCLAAGADEQGRPSIPGMQAADLLGAAHLISGILLALWRAQRTGRGARVEVALSDVALHFAALNLAIHHAPIASAAEDVRRHLQGALPQYRLYRCADGRYLALAGLEPVFREGIVQTLGIPPDRAQDDQALGAALAERLAERPLADWRAQLEGAGLCVSGVLDYHDAARERLHVERGMIVWRELPGGAVVTTGQAIRIDGQAPVAQALAPRLSADADALLMDLGYDQGQREALYRADVVRAPTP